MIIYDPTQPELNSKDGIQGKRNILIPILVLCQQITSLLPSALQLIRSAGPSTYDKHNKRLIANSIGNGMRKKGKSALARIQRTHIVIAYNLSTSKISFDVPSVPCSSQSCPFNLILNFVERKEEEIYRSVCQDLVHTHT